MIQMTVSGLAVDNKQKAPLVVLSDANKIRALPLWVGVAEANAISNALSGEDNERPTTHQLLLASIEAQGNRVSGVCIHKVENKTYFAMIEVMPKTAKRKSRKTLYLDARPSDAIAVALLAKAPIFVAPEVLAQTSIPFDTHKEHEERKAFVSFIDQVKASDFRLPR